MSEIIAVLNESGGYGGYSPFVRPEETDFPEEGKAGVLYISTVNHTINIWREGAYVCVGHGKSAYELALSEGYSGTLAEWIASLKGEIGNVGAQGETGATGNGIASVARTAQSGLVDTYTITFTDGTTTSYTVTNGAVGATGATGATGARGAQGIQGERGAPFQFHKVYASVAEMNAGYATDTEVPENGIVLINTGNVQDADNAKIYYKGSTAYTYLTDLSGSAGIQGTQGVAGIGVPAGGTTGQVLKKVDGTDYNTQWADGGGGGTGDVTKEFIESKVLGYPVVEATTKTINVSYDANWGTCMAQLSKESLSLPYLQNGIVATVTAGGTTTEYNLIMEGEMTEEGFMATWCPPNGEGFAIYGGEPCISTFGAYWTVLVIDTTATSVSISIPATKTLLDKQVQSLPVQLSIGSTSWVADSSISPFTVKAIITDSGLDSIDFFSTVSMTMDVLEQANHGIVLAEADTGTVTLYAIVRPSQSLSVYIIIGG